MLGKQIKSNYEASGRVNRGGEGENGGQEERNRLYAGDDDFDWRAKKHFLTVAAVSCV